MLLSCNRNYEFCSDAFFLIKIRITLFLPLTLNFELDGSGESFVFKFDSKNNLGHYPWTGERGEKLLAIFLFEQQIDPIW